MDHSSYLGKQCLQYLVMPEGFPILSLRRTQPVPTAQGPSPLTNAAAS